ncbi:M20/M25/M40 family metallo-hydrolase [Sediminicoccus sp. KRV36]|uniref:M20/M25/M40 family metallo-hydrolase n=1 Tax=Sediminicoccus sp. KRV36 TaxID=3133721 RepID=UPI00200CECE1|nr:M20/M25/M40 family metallo-hydrolase [Sediminicoccus rosea]UPY36895.1 M20/M25/M40 family metallo-hydrolase [Sediminicoccus rosea]
MEQELAALAADLVRMDSRSSLSNLEVAERIEAELDGFEIERLDYVDAGGVAKRALVAHRGGPGGLALSGHMDTVPATGWTDDPWSGAIRDGVLHGLGSVDMKGAVAACVMAARRAPRATLLITTDEETTKQGARIIAGQSVLAKRAGLAGIIVAEPTSLIPVRGHRAHIAFTATAEGVQAHSSTGKGLNANWALIPFLVEASAMFERLRSDPSLQDDAYDPVFSDFNLVVDNHGTAVNVTVAKATARIKFRYSHRVDPAPVLLAMREAARANGLTLEEAHEGHPPELPLDHPLVRRACAVTGVAARTAPYGTDASELQAIAPCVVLGPGSIETAHTPFERVSVAELLRAVDVFGALLNGDART